MKTTIPTAEEIFNEISSGDLSWCKDLKQVGIETAKKLAKFHVQACKEEIADDYLYYLDGDESSERLDNKKFFKEVYPIENIK